MRSKIAALTGMIPVCQTACFSPFHTLLLSPSLAQDETSVSLPTLIFIWIQHFGFVRLQERTIKGHVLIYLPKHAI